MLMYHLHRKGYADDLWIKGNLIKKYDENFFWKLCLDFKPWLKFANEKSYPFINVYEYYKNSNNIFSHLNLLSSAVSIIEEYQILLREVVLENVRREFFPQLPSRTNCIWLCRKNQINYWKNAINDETVVYEVKIDENKLFKTNSELLPLPSDSYNQIVLKAKQYYKYKNVKELSSDEYLYDGDITVVKKINNW